MTPETQPAPDHSEVMPMENLLVAAVLVATGGVGVLLGLLRPACTLEAGFGVLLLALGLHTLREAMSRS
jgi:hypothetical protein